MKKTKFSLVVMSFMHISLLFIGIKAKAQEDYKTVEEAKGLLVGAKVTDLKAKDQNDQSFVLSEALLNGPIVLIFYRGQWCPVCNKYLSNLQDSLQFIIKKGARVIAVSPEKPEYLKKTEVKSNTTFTLLYDQDHKISDAFDVTFLPEKLTRIKYNSLLGADLKTAHDNTAELLPIPATFIIDQNSTIIWRHFDPDYKIRSTVKDILINIPEGIKIK